LIIQKDVILKSGVCFQWKNAGRKARRFMHAATAIRRPVFYWKEVADILGIQSMIRSLAGLFF